MIPDTAHWIRSCRLRVGKRPVIPAGASQEERARIIREPVVGREFTDALKIEFEIVKTVYRTPNTATIKIYNLAEENETQIHDEFNDVELDVGYADDRHGLFRGNIRYVYRYRDGNERIAEIEAADGDKDFKDGEVNFTLASGHTDVDAIRRLLQSLGTTVMGYVAGANILQPKIRAKTYSGTVRKVMDIIARNNDAHWSIQDGKLSMVPVGSTIPNEAIRVDSTTGLLGAPTISDKGIALKMQLDPRIVPGCKIWLDNTDVKNAKFEQSMLAILSKKKQKANVRADPDGIYKVFAVEHKGDTRGGDWTTEAKCIALDVKIPSSKGTVPISGLVTMQ